MEWNDADGPPSARPMLSSGRCSLPIRSLFLLLAIALPGVLAAQVLQSNDIVNFRLRDGIPDYRSNDGQRRRPLQFSFRHRRNAHRDRPGLARQLQLPVIGEASLTTVSDVRQDQLVRLKQSASRQLPRSPNWERSSINWIRSSSRLQAFAACWARIFSRTSTFSSTTRAHLALWRRRARWGSMSIRDDGPLSRRANHQPPAD
jgi:hypothetical protein